MSANALVWAASVAPVADVQEYAVLVRMADEADEYGCGAFLSTATIARDIQVSEKTVQRRIDAMLARKLLGLGDQTKAAYIRADRRPVVYDLLIPSVCFADLARTNQRRADKQLPPITPRNRPLQDQPPAAAQRARRSDVGKQRVKKVDAPPADDGVTTSPPDHGASASPPVATGGLVVPDGGTSSPARGDYQSPDPGFDPGTSNPPPPYPPSTGQEPPRREARKEGEGDPKVSELVKSVRDLRADWTSGDIRRTVDVLREQGRPFDLIVAGFTIAAADHTTRLPRRLEATAWPGWRQAAALVQPEPAAAAPRGVVCGRCDDTGWIDADSDRPIRCRHGAAAPAAVA